MPRLRPLAILVIISAPLAGCSSADPAQAGAAGRQAKQVSVVAVQRDAVRRAVDVVGTLTAVDQVTVSSEADGTVRAILADLGDRVQTGQVLVRLDNERQQYCLPTAAGGARAHARAVRREGPPASAGAGKHAGRAEGECRARAGAQCVRSCQGAVEARARRATGLRRRPGRAADQTGGLRGGAAERQELERQHTSVRGRDEAVRTPGSRHRDSRALRRVYRTALDQSGRAGEGADAGDGHRAARSVEGDRRNSRADGAMDR